MWKSLHRHFITFNTEHSRSHTHKGKKRDIKRDQKRNRKATGILTPLDIIKTPIKVAKKNSKVFVEETKSVYSQERGFVPDTLGLEFSAFSLGAYNTDGTDALT